MNPRLLSFPLYLAICASLALAQSPAQESYSLSMISNMTEASLLSGRNSNMTVYRNGTKELVEVTLDQKPGQPSMRMRYLFDFQAHKAYTFIPESNTCSWMKYVSANAPISYDPITGSATMLAEMSKLKPKILGPESINGIPAVAQELAVEGQGKTKIWLAEKGNFIVKLEVFGPDGKPMMNMEVKQLRFAKPQETLFSTPANCSNQTQGEWSETGMNARTQISVEANVSANVSENRVEAEATARSTVSDTPEASPTPQQSGDTRMEAASPRVTSSVTEVRLRIVPERYVGPCPGQLRLIAEITTDGPGIVWYQFLAGAVSNSPEGRITFEAAGTKTVSIDGKFRTAPQVPEAAVIAIMEDEAGNHGPQNVSSEDVPYNITCK